MVPSERIAGMEQEPKSNKVNSDLILWLLAAALAIVLFLVEKTPFWTALLLFVLSLLLIHPVMQIYWIRNTRMRQLLALLLMAGLTLCFGFMVWPKSDKGLTGPAYGYSIVQVIIMMILKELTNPKVQNLLCIIFGMLLLTSFQHLVNRIKSTQQRTIGRRTGIKGFLDYKMQAEDGMKRLPPALNKISKIVTRVGCSLEKHTRSVQGVTNSSARIQLKKVQRTANMLDGYSRQLNKSCGDLEEIGDSLAEGIEEWLKWISKQPGGHAANLEIGPLRGLVDVMEGTLKSTNFYITSVEAIRGVSSDMNDAVDTHLISVTRIRDANEKIMKSCQEGLRHLDAIDRQ